MAAVLYPVAAALSVAQVAIDPTTTQPAAWERFAVRVANPSDTAVVEVIVEVPEAVTILGVEPLTGWSAEVVAATDTTPQTIRWWGGELRRREFLEFALLGRVMGDARRKTLVFPVHAEWTGGERRSWSGLPGSRRAAPRVTIVGPAQLSIRGSVALAGVAIALSVIAIALTLAQRRKDDSTL
jgi:uncharacterized protein YcnI